MSIEELLNKRYKVIADYPGMIHNIGDIITGECAYLVSTGDEEDGTKQSEDGYMGDYPHLFRPLQWWEDRAVEDMPEYVNYYGRILMVIRHKPMHSNHKVFQVMDGVVVWCSYDIVTPATEAEYLTYKNQTK